MAPLHPLCSDDWNKVQDEISCHVIPLALALASRDAEGVISGIIKFLGHGDYDVVQNALFHHLILLASPPHDTNGITNGTWYWSKYQY